MSYKCKVVDGRHVEPCETLRNATDYRSSEGRKGICVWAYTNIKTNQPSRTMYGVKTKAHPKGLLFNVCPFCGERIDAPFADTESEAK